MIKHWKLSLLAICTISLALVLILGTTMGSAAAPDPQLSNDLVLIGNGGTGANNVKIVDVDSMAVVNTIAGGTGLANNHGVLLDGSGRYLYNSNNALVGPAPLKHRVTKFDIASLTQVGVIDGASADQYALTSGICGLEWNMNDASTGKIWAASMSGGISNGGLYEIDAATNSFTGNFVDNTAGTDNGATCGIAWNSSGSIAYAAAMNAKKTSSIAWPGSTIGSTVAETTPLHMLDTAKAANYAYVAAGVAAGVGYIDIVDLNTMTVVNHMITGNPSHPHDTNVAHNEGFMYAHSRTGSAGTDPGTLLIYDIGGGTAGGTKTSPVLIGSIPDQGTSSVSCGTQLLTKSNYCGAPALGLSLSNIHWGSYADYTAGTLSVDANIANTAINAYNVQIVGTSNSNGVTLISPVTVGNIPAGTTATATVQYHVPTGVASFSSTVYATAGDLCNNTHAYPGPYAGA